MLAGFVMLGSLAAIWGILELFDDSDDDRVISDNQPGSDDPEEQGMVNGGSFLPDTGGTTAGLNSTNLEDGNFPAEETSETSDAGTTNGTGTTDTSGTGTGTSDTSTTDTSGSDTTDTSGTTDSSGTTDTGSTGTTDGSGSDTDTSMDTTPTLPPGAVSGTAGADSLTGTTGLDSIFGLAGNDTIDGAGESDLIEGGAGDDSLIGGSFFDTLGGGDGDDTLTGDAGRDVLLGNDGDDVLQGGTWADTLIGGAGADSLDGGSGADVLAGGFFPLGPDLDVDFGHDFDAQTANTLFEQQSADPTFLETLTSGDFSSDPALADVTNPFETTAEAETSPDTLIGAGGDDELWLGAGDSGNGGAGADVFLVAPATTGAPAVIEDYVAGTDSIQIPVTPSDGTVVVSVTDEGADALVSTNGHVVARVTGAAGQLTASDVTLV